MVALPEELDAEEERRRVVPASLVGEDAAAANRLRKLGIHCEEAEELVRTYGRERVVRQIVWLPLRRAKS